MKEMFTLQEIQQLAEKFIPTCYDSDHDDRWCSNCESMRDGIEAFVRELEKL